jgi:hypothetical protein
VLLNDTIPLPSSINKIFDNLIDFILRGPNLYCRVSLTESNRSVLESLKVDGDAKRCSQFVVAGVSFPNRLVRIIDFV